MSNARAQRDGNFVPTKLAVSAVDGVTIDTFTVNPQSHGIEYSDGTGGNTFTLSRSLRDVNFVPSMTGISSIDSVTVTALATDGSGNLLIKSS